MKASAKAGLLALTIILIQLAGGVLLAFLPQGMYAGQYAIISYMLLYIAPVFIIPLVLGYDLRQTFYLDKISLRNVVILCVITILLMPFMSFLSYISSLFFPNSAAKTLLGLSGEPLLLSVFAFGFMPAVSEELMFRGLIFSQYKKIGLDKGVLATGLVFAMAHFSPQQFLYAFFMGALLCVFVHKTQSILASVIPHFIINTSQVILANLAYGGVSDLEEYVSAFELKVFASLLVSGLFTLLAAIYLTKHFLKTPNEETPEGGMEEGSGENEPEDAPFPKEPAEPKETEEGRSIFSPPLFVIMGIYALITIFVHMS